MPIEFACDSCTKLLRVPDGTEGRSCECPSCGKLLDIPDPNAIEVVEVADENNSTKTIQVSCPKCRHALVCSAELLGSKGQCKSCSYIFRITTDPVDAAQQVNSDLIFNCPRCNQLFDGSEEMRGRKGKCHVCGEVFPIELKAAQHDTPLSPAGGLTPSPKPASSRPAHAPTPRPAKDLSPVKKRKPVKKQSPARQPAATGTIQLSCPDCSGVMEVPTSAAGQNTACPFCSTLLEIPDDTASKKTPTRSPALNSRSSDPLAASSSNSTGDIWSELGDLSGAAQTASNVNPYQAPIDSGNAWSAPPKSKTNFRGLSFSNAFGLVFDTAFPSVLIAPALFVPGVIVCLAIMFASAFAGSLASGPIVEGETPIAVLAMAGLGALISVVIASVLTAMICNVALRAVRRKPVSVEVVFSTGGSFSCVLVLMLLWTVFRAAQQFGVPAIIGPMVQSGQRETALVVALTAIIGIFVIQVVTYFLFCSAPFAMIDGRDLGESLQLSMSILFSNFFTIVGASICCWLLYVAVSVVSCGIGAILLVGLQAYMHAAIYHLADK